jgi:hypothetical protein
MKKVFRFLAISAVVAGAGIAYMASREDGRQQLARIGSSVNNNLKALGEFANSLHQSDTNDAFHRHISQFHQDSNTQRQNDLVSTY